MALNGVHAARSMGYTIIISVLNDLIKIYQGGIISNISEGKKLLVLFDSRIIDNIYTTPSD